MQNTLLLLAFLTISPLIDSLSNLLQQHKNTDNKIETCNTLLGIARAYQMEGAMVQSDSMLQLLKEEATAADYKKGLAEYYYETGRLLAGGGDLNGASESFEFIAKNFENDLDVDYLSKVYNAISHLNYQMGQPDKCIEYAEKGMTLLDKVSTDGLKGHILLKSANKENAFGSDEEAIRLTKRAIQYFELEKDTMGLFYGNFNIGLYLSELGNLDSSLVYFEKNIVMARSFGHVEEELYAIQEMANVYLVMGRNETAIEFLKEGIALSEKNKITWFIGKFSILKGKAYAANKDYDAALLAFQKARKLGEENQILPSEIQGKEGEVSAYKAKEDFEKALVVAKDLYDFYVEGKDVQGQSSYLSDMGDCYRGLGQYEKALEAHRQALHIATLNQIDHLYGEICLALVSDFEKVEKADSMLFYANEAKSNLTLNGNLEGQANVENAFYRAYKLNGNQGEALAYHEKWMDLKDQIYLKKSQGYVATERVKQNVEKIEEDKDKAEQAAALLSARNKLFAAIALGLMGILLVGGYLFAQLRKTKRKIESQNTQLQQLNTTKDKFFGIIAHDIRSPIVALKGVGNLMQHYLKKDDKPKLERLATRIDNTASQLNGLLDNLLNWALLQQGVIPYHPHALSVKEVSEDVLKMFESNAASKGIHLEANIDEALEVHADESAFNTILRNLVSNAIKFTPEGGSVSLSTDLKDNKIFINVNDTGTGIAAEKLSSLFELQKKSEQGTAGEKGTGLGLSLVKELVNLNKGLLKVESIVNQGSKFSVALPIAT